MKNFASDTEFKAAIENALAAAGANDAIRAALAAGIDQGENEHRAETESADGALHLRFSNWVLRGRDMPVVELIGIVGAAATAALAPGTIAVGIVVTALTSFATLCWKASRKGANLSKAEVAVLGFVEVHGPISGDDLVKATSSLRLTKTDIDNALLTLQRVELNDGDVVTMIRQDAAGQWRAQTA